MSLSFIFLLLITHHLSPASAQSSSIDDTLHTYIVHVEPPPETASLSSSSYSDNLKKWYKTFLPPSTAASSATESRILYAYKNIVTGFAARFTEQELAGLQEKPGFLHAYPDGMARLQTTHTPYFLGLHRDRPGLWNHSGYGKGVIIGVFDTGILPSHPSFSDDGMPPPPAKWKGVCEFNASDCNNKIIGARNFIKGSSSMSSSATDTAADGPNDVEGHGTHVASTAAAREYSVRRTRMDCIECCRLKPMERCPGAWPPLPPSSCYFIKCVRDRECATSDILAGMDAAVDDGVDIMSLSIVWTSMPYYSDPMAIGAFSAVERGIFVSFAAGNDGPGYSTLSNEAPWILTVGASTTDRSIRTMVELGNKVSFDGQSAYQPSNFSRSPLPLVYPSLLNLSATFCSNSSLDSVDVRGKVVVCDNGNVDLIEKGENVKKAGGAAMIIANYRSDGDTTDAIPHRTFVFKLNSCQL
ncbi:subtilisin-like protease SBT1.4 [Asparagus officinalis]|uniref:subtilisin-like protease SBT1.4 n=1 Tax=Asparagus officinalis TaxID=4686 RepID=UPI00098E6624|nr:subtilisin-like protease SBT1.4 [Asparagus officinalis]